MEVVFDNVYTGGNWTSNSTIDSCSYVEQGDGSVLISTKHGYANLDYCHEYWECDNSDHQMFFKWNRVNIEENFTCKWDWARFAWGTADGKQELLCSEDNDLTKNQKWWRNTGTNKIVWDFYADEGVTKWGAEAQIICRDPSEVNECIEGSHDCDESAECIDTEEGYNCQCPSPQAYTGSQGYNGIKWGDQTVTSTSAGTLNDPCTYTHPDFPSIELNIFTYDGKPTIYHQTYGKNFTDSVKYCAGLGMHLPVPNTEQQYQDLKTILRYNRRVWLGYADSATEGKWLNIYNDEELAIDKWADGEPDDGVRPDNNVGDGEDQVATDEYGTWYDVDLSNIEYYRKTLCMRTNLEIELDFCGMNLHDCDEAAECIKTEGKSGYNCRCPSTTIKWGDQTLSPTGAGTTRDPCKYTHPDFQSIEIFPIEWDGETLGVVFEREHLTWQAAFDRCNELGMTLPLPSNYAENAALTNFLLEIDEESYQYTTFLGAYNSNDEGKWVNLYSNEEITYSQWSANQPDNAEKVAEISDNGKWNDVNLTNKYYHGLVCIMTDYDDYKPEAIDLCETGLNQCHASASCVNYTGNSTYQCACSDVTVEGTHMTPMSATVSVDCYGAECVSAECRYTLTEYVGSNVEVNIFTYDGKPTIYHHTYGMSYADAVKYCAGFDMHLPVPNTEQQYQDLKTIPRYSDRQTYWLGYTDSANEGTWLNIYNGEELAIDKWGDGEPDDTGAEYDGVGEDHIEMYQYNKNDIQDISIVFKGNGVFQWNDVNPDYSYYRRSTLCLRTDLKIEIDYCRMNLHDCSLDAICNNSGTGNYTCICPNVQIGDLDLEPASNSTGKGSDGCHYFHPNADGVSELYQRAGAP